jgi:hypothetical protein
VLYPGSHEPFVQKLDKPNKLANLKHASLSCHRLREKEKSKRLIAGINVLCCSDSAKNNYNVWSVIVSGMNKVTNLTLSCST